jgi:hypothetical protein
MAKTKFAVELKAGKEYARFSVGGQRIELTQESPRYETTDEAIYRGLLNRPFLKEATDKSEGGAD